jgi:hypothetical protein
MYRTSGTVALPSQPVIVISELQPFGNLLFGGA